MTMAYRGAGVSVRWLGLLLCALLVTVVAAPARAQDRRALLERGKAERMAGDEVAALNSFTRAHAISPSAESFGLMGASEYNLSRWVDAEIHLTEALRAKDDPWVQRHRVKLTQLLATVRTQLGWIEIVGTPAGAEVEVAGRPVGRLPLPQPVRVAGGEVNVRLAAPGYKVARRDVDVSYDQVTRVNIDLERGPGVDPYDRNARAKGGSRAADPVVEGEITALPPRGGGGGSGLRTAGWVVAGAGAVFAAGGIAALIIKESNVTRFNDHNKQLMDEARRCNEAKANAGGGPCPTYLDRARTAKTLAYVAFTGAGLAALVSGILISAAPSGDQAALGGRIARTEAPACLPTLGEGLGGACRFRF